MLSNVTIVGARPVRLGAVIHEQWNGFCVGILQE